MSFLEELSDNFNEYSGLMSAGGMLQRHSMLTTQERTSAATQELVELQRRQAEAQRKQQERAMRLMEKEQSLRLKTEQSARECRYLISYAAQILSEHSDCPLARGTVRIIGQLVEDRLTEANLSVQELQSHQQNQTTSQKSSNGAATETLDQLTQHLQAVTKAARGWIHHRDQLCETYYRHQQHPMWAAYCIPPDSLLSGWLPIGEDYDSISSSLILEHNHLAIPDEISENLMARVSAITQKIQPGIEKLIESEPAPTIDKIFRKAKGLLVWTDDYSHLLNDDQTAFNMQAGPSELSLSRPPEVTHFKVGQPVLLFLNLAEDVHDGNIRLPPIEHEEISHSYQRFMSALRGCDDALECMHRVLVELLEVKNGNLEKTVNTSLAVLIHRRDNQKAEVSEALRQVKLGNVRRAAELADFLLGQRDTHTSQKLGEEISRARAPLQRMQELQRLVLEEYERLNTPIRRAWGPGFGKVYQELETRLRKLNVAVRQSKYPPTSELGGEVDKVIESVVPACELAELCFTWKKPRVTLSDLIAKLQPRATHPASAYINAMCAIAAADGEFCLEEQRKIEELLESAPINLTATSIKNVIGHWCDKARSGSVLQMIAQSVVDTRVLRGQPELANAMIRDLYSVAKADGEASHSEGIVYKAIKSELGVKS